MARRRPSSNDDEISLFPFLSIVACVIGVLTMMIATLALAQTDAPDIAEIEKHESLQKKIEETKEAIKALEQKIAVSSKASLHLRETQKALAMSAQELEAMMKQIEEIDAQLAELRMTPIVIPELDPALRETMEDLNDQLAATKEAIAQLELDLKKRKDVPTESNVTILPQGSGLTFVPHFIECDAGALVMHNLPKPKRVRLADAAKDKDFVALMNLVAKGKDDTIVFLIRDDGLGTYYTLRNMCNRNSVRNGKIPVVGNGRIDLSVFAKNKK